MNTINLPNDQARAVSLEVEVIDTKRASDDQEWHEHEHTTAAVQIQAEHLLETAGSPELAKHAIDLAAHQAHESDVQTLMVDG